MQDSGTFLMDYEPNTSIGDIAERPKVQKFHEPEELQALLLERWRVVDVRTYAPGLSAICRDPKPISKEDLAQAIEFEFDPNGSGWSARPRRPFAVD